MGAVYRAEIVLSLSRAGPTSDRPALLMAIEELNRSQHGKIR
jgi:hypothetical protein